MKFKPYRLFLTEDTRNQLLYREFIGLTGTKKDYYKKSLKVGDERSQKYRREKVGLKTTKVKGKILIVEIADASL